MSSSLLKSILVDQSGNISNISVGNILLCVLTSVFLGLLVAKVHMFRNYYSKNFVITLVVLPVLVQLVIMLVNGNLGTGMAVLGAFSLIRFRSVPGGSRDITSIFWSMGIGLATGMGYIGSVFIFSMITALILIALNVTKFGESNQTVERQLRITLSEELDFPGLFDDVFEKYAYRVSTESVKTTNMGSLYELRYNIKLKDKNQEKMLIDEIRVMNGNLPVMLGRVASNHNEL